MEEMKFQFPSTFPGNVQFISIEALLDEIESLRVKNK